LCHGFAGSYEDQTVGQHISLTAPVIKATGFSLTLIHIVFLFGGEL